MVKEELTYFYYNEIEEIKRHSWYSASEQIHDTLHDTASNNVQHTRNKIWVEYRQDMIEIMQTKVYEINKKRRNESERKLSANAQQVQVCQ